MNGAMPAWGHVFLPRPEEVTYTHPTRSTVHQTLGGGWVDDFGPGLVDINISGHTGWRGSFGVPGEVMAYNLRNACNQLYHDLRRERALSGKNPDDVEMIFVDTLNVCAYVVYPTSFQLRRNRHRPLLYMYQMRLTATREFFSLNGAVSDMTALVRNGLGALL